MKEAPNLKCNGFTIVETIVSVAIIGVLAAAVVTTFLGKTESVQADGLIQDNQVAVPNSDNFTSHPAWSNNSLQYIDAASENADVQTKAELASREMEHRIVQTALDLMMVSQDLAVVTTTSSTSDMSVFPRGNPLYPRYVRERFSQYSYSCNSSGEVCTKAE